MARPTRGRRTLNQAIDHSDRPIYLLDAQRKVVFANAACLAWLGLTSDDLLGQSCPYHVHSSSPSSVTAGLGPPPSAYGASTTAGRVWRRLQGELEERPAQFHLISGGETEDVLLAVVDIQGTVPEEERNNNRPDSERLHRQVLEFHQRQAKTPTTDLLIGEHPRTRQLRRQFAIAQTSQDHVCFVGQPGSGRRLLARSLQELSKPESSRRIIECDAALLDEELWESVLGDIQSLFVDIPTAGIDLLVGHIDHLDEGAQRILLKFLDRWEARCRVYATSCRPLGEVQSIRETFAARLSVLVINVPSLRERLSDLPVLVQALLESCNEREAKQRESFSGDALRVLVNHPWTRGLEELIEVVDAAHQHSANPMIDVTDLPERIHLTAQADRFPRREEVTIDLEAYLAGIEAELLRRALRQADGNRAQAARLLGISRTKLLRRLAALGINEPI